MNDKRIGKIRTKAERDSKLSSGSFHLLMRICSHVYVDPHKRFEDSFALPWTKVAEWCWLSDRDTCYARISELVKGGYLKCDGLRGCPPKQHYALLSNCRENPANECRQNPAIKYGRNPAINCRQNPQHQISTSSRKKDLKKEEDNGSLRSTETSRGNNSSSAIAPSKGLTAEERTEAIRELQRQISAR